MLVLNSPSFLAEAEEKSSGTTTGAQPRVTSVVSDADGKSEGALNEIISITVANLSRLRDEATCQGDFKKNDCRAREIVLFVNQRKIEGTKPLSMSTDTLKFRLERSAKSDEVWADLLGAPRLDSTFLRLPVSVSVGLADGLAVPAVVADDKAFMIIRIRPLWSLACLILFAVMIYYLMRLSSESSMLRESTGDLLKPLNLRAQYSLARFQMALWFVLVVAAFLFIWLVTGNYDTINETVLVLIGIGAGTALGAAAVDASGERKEAFAKAIQALPQPNIPPADKKAIEEKWGSHGFIVDVLSDSSGISFHRFQMFIWTLVLAILFLYSVWSRLSMPTFSATLLGLLGISAGTYLGFKFPEQRK